MLLAWLTDIHLDHLEPAAVADLSRTVAARNPDVVVVTGDISVAARLEQHLVDFAAEFGAPVYFVAGNHDYWGSRVSELRHRLGTLHQKRPRLRWLPAQGPVLLTDEHALVGVDGWADARLGDALGSPVRLRDYAHIGELADGDDKQGIAAARAIADADAAQLRTLLREALALRHHVIVATHVPPFAEAARYHGFITTPHFLPWVTSKAVGDALLEVAGAHPDHRITVLCGHMHHRAHEQIRENLLVRTGAATYGAPTVADVLEL